MIKLDPECDYRAIVSTIEGQATVAINSNSHYTKTIKFANELFEKLKQTIPFKYTITNKSPTLEVLGGRRVLGKLSVEFNIKFGITNAEARRLFDEAGFFKDFECIK